MCHHTQRLIGMQANDQVIVGRHGRIERFYPVIDPAQHLAAWIDDLAFIVVLFAEDAGQHTLPTGDSGDIAHIPPIPPSDV